MKQKTLIYMVIKPSIVLAAAVLTAASFLAPSTATAEDPTYLMPTGRGGGHTDDGIQPFDPNPAAPDSRTRVFLTYGVDADGTEVPLKTLRITNNTADTVYPIMRDPNSNVLASNKGWACMTLTTRQTRNTAATLATRRAENITSV